MEYNNEIKDIDEVFEEFPQFEGEVNKLPFAELIEKFSKEEYNNLIEDAKFYKEKVTAKKKEQFEEISHARAVYRFCWGWSTALDISISKQYSAKWAKNLIGRMLKSKKDPFAKDSFTVADYVNRYSRKRSSWGKFTDAEAMRDVEDFDD